MPVINNPEKQKNEKGQYEIDFPEDSVDNNPVDNNKAKDVFKDKEFKDKDPLLYRLEEIKPQTGVKFNQNYIEKILSEERNEEPEPDDNIREIHKDDWLEKEIKDIEKSSSEKTNSIEESNLEEKKRVQRIKNNKVFRDLAGKDLSYEDKEKIVQVHEKISNLKSSIKRIIFEIFEELYHDKSIDMSTIDIKYIWDIVSETRKTSPKYVQEIMEYLNANKILGCCIKKLRDGQLKEVYEKLKSLYRSGHNSHEIVTNYREYEEMLKILES